MTEQPEVPRQRIWLKHKPYAVGEWHTVSDKKVPVRIPRNSGDTTIGEFNYYDDFEKMYWVRFYEDDRWKFKKLPAEAFCAANPDLEFCCDTSTIEDPHRSTLPPTTESTTAVTENVQQGRSTLRGGICQLLRRLFKNPPHRR